MAVQLILLILASLAAGTIVSGFLYFRQRQYDEKGLVWVMFVLRALAFAVFFFVAVAPLIPLKDKVLLKPVVAVLVDNSSSMLAGADSAQIKESLQAELETELDNIADANISYRAFDRTLIDKTPDFQGSESNLAQALRQTFDEHDRDRLAAVVMVSDGIYNRGENPLYVAEEGLTPILTLGIGDSAQQRDLAIVTVNAPRFAYRGDDVLVEVTVKANALAGETTSLTLARGGGIVARKEIKITDNNFAAVIPFSIKTAEPGLFAYDLSLQEHPNERNTRNNNQRFYLEVIENRKQITVVSAAPAPDVAALREALKVVDAFEVTYQKLGTKTDLSKTDLLALFIQPGGTPEQYQTLLNTYKGPLWLITDPAVNGRVFDRILPGFAMTNARESRKAKLVIDESFGLFRVSEESRQKLQQLPATLVPAGAIATPVPFMNLVRNKQEIAALYGETANRRMAIFAFSGLWQARVQDFVSGQTHRHVDEWLQLTAQYLTAATNKDRLRLYYEPRVAKGHPVQIRAEVYDAAFNPSTTAQVSLVLTDEKGSETDFSFAPANNSYQLEMSGLRPGIYTFKATARLGDETLYESGEFLVEDIGLEQLNSRADFGLLNQMAVATNGAFFVRGQEAALADAIAELPGLKPIERITYQAIPLVDIWWLLLIAVALLATEWVLRRYFGRI